MNRSDLDKIDAIIDREFLKVDHKKAKTQRRRAEKASRKWARLSKAQRLEILSPVYDLMEESR